MNMDAIVFYSTAVIIIVFFFRVMLINIKVTRYVKKCHPNVWDDYKRLGSGGLFGAGSNPFQVINSLGLDDPKIEQYKIAWDKALKQLLFAVLLIIIFSFCYIAFLRD